MFCICPHTTIWYFLQSLALTLTLIMVRSHHVARIFHPFLIYWHNIFATYLDKKCLHASQWSSVKCFFFGDDLESCQASLDQLGQKSLATWPSWSECFSMFFQVDADSTSWEVLCKGGVFFLQSYSTLLRRWQTCRLACEFLRQLPLTFTRNWSLNLHELISEYCVLWCLGRPRRHWI